ncbi:hypothetical protein Dimus_009110 [Dionaea muscipula]
MLLQSSFLLKKSCRSCCTLGILVDSPTRTTSWTELLSILASLKHFSTANSSNYEVSSDGGDSIERSESSIDDTGSKLLVPEGQIAAVEGLMLVSKGPLVLGLHPGGSVEVSHSGSPPQLSLTLMGFVDGCGVREEVAASSLVDGASLAGQGRDHPVAEAADGLLSAGGGAAVDRVDAAQAEWPPLSQASRAVPALGLWVLPVRLGMRESADSRRRPRKIDRLHL